MLRLKTLLAIVWLFIPAWAYANTSLDLMRIAQLDAHALAAPPNVETSFAQLAEYLVKPARSDAEKARLIYRWITDRVTYDVDAYLGKTAMRDTSAETVLTSRSSVCEGYATLFERLGTLAGLEVASVRGYAKGYGKPVTAEMAPNHAWNAVKLDGRWYLIDATWGAGHVEADRFKKVFSESYFLAPAEQMLFTHFPENDRWQFQSTGRLSRDDFNALPALSPGFFNLGIKGEKVWKALQEAKFKAPLVQTFDVPWRAVEVASAPVLYELKLNQTYEYRIHSSAFEKMAIVHNQTWNYMEKEGDAFVLRFTPNAGGEVLLAGKQASSENFTGILAYKANE